MAIFRLRHYQGTPPSFFKLFTLSVPLFFCLLSWASSTTAPTPPPPLPSALAASQVLKTHGYFLFSKLIAAAAGGSGSHSWNGTGTIFVPPDFAFTFAASKFNNHRRSPRPRPSASLFLYHSLKQPLRWHDLTSRADIGELPTWQANRCLFVSKGFNGDLAIAGAKKPTSSAIKIRQPDLYVDDHLAVHGVDGVLDPASVSKCSFPAQAAQIKLEIDQSFLDHAARVLRRRGFGVVATAMALKRPSLMSLAAVTIFAPSDASLFSGSNGFRYDFLRHVVPRRHSFTDIAGLPPGTAIETLSPNKTVHVRAENSDVTVNGVSIDSSEVYQNGWIVVISVSRSLDDAGNSEAETRISDSGIAVSPSFRPSPFGDSAVPSPSAGELSVSVSSASIYDYEMNSQSPSSEQSGVPSPGSSYSDEMSRNAQSQAPATQGDALADWRCPPGVSPANRDGVVSTMSPMVEGGDLFCPVTGGPRDSESTKGAYVDQSVPSTAYGQISEKLVQSGPSHEFNRPAETVVESTPFDENESEQLSKVSAVEMRRRELSSHRSGGSGPDNGGRSSVPRGGDTDRRDQLNVADDLFFYV